MRDTGNDRWTGAFEVDALGRWTYTVVAWVDRFASWRDELRRKVAGGQTDFASEGCASDTRRGPASGTASLIV